MSLGADVGVTHIPLEGTMEVALDAYDTAPDRELFDALTYQHDNDPSIPGRGNRPVSIKAIFKHVFVSRWTDQIPLGIDQEIVNFDIEVDPYIAGYPVPIDEPLRMPAVLEGLKADAPKWGQKMGVREVAMAFSPLALNSWAYTGKRLFTPSTEPHHHPAGGGLYYNRFSEAQALGPLFDLDNLTASMASELIDWAMTQLVENQTRQDERDQQVYSSSRQRLLVIVNTPGLHKVFAPLARRSTLLVENDAGTAMVPVENEHRDQIVVRYIPSFGQAFERRVVFVDLNSEFKPVCFIDDSPLETGIFEDKQLPNGWGRAGCRRFMGAGSLWPQPALDVYKNAGG